MLSVSAGGGGRKYLCHDRREMDQNDHSCHADQHSCACKNGLTVHAGLALSGNGQGDEGEINLFPFVGNTEFTCKIRSAADDGPVCFA